VQPLNRRGGTEAFTSLFVKEMLVRVSLAVVAMLLAGAGSLVGRSLGADWGDLVGAVVGLAVGIVLAVLVLRRR
jgi:tetrahydromethanopterin S-methyltransferase subunit G